MYVRFSSASYNQGIRKLLSQTVANESKQFKETKTMKSD